MGMGNQEFGSWPGRILGSVGNALMRLVIGHPWAVVAAWLMITVGVVATAPDLTKLAAEGQAHLVPEDAESTIAKKLVERAWPEQAYQSVAVALLQREGGLTAEDRAYIEVACDEARRARAAEAGSEGTGARVST